MTNAAQAKPRDTNDYFLSIPHHLLQARGFVSRTTGEVLDLSLTELVIFQWMKGCYDSYKKIGNPYHESQRSIANACRVSREVVIRVMKLFEQHGYLDKEKKWDGCNWILPHSLEAVSKEIQEQPEKVSNKPVEAFSSESDTSIAPASKSACNELIEGNSKDIASDDVQDKPISAVDRAFKLNIHRPAASTAPAAHLQEDIPIEHYGDYYERDYGYCGPEIGNADPFWIGS
nr:helix-turn-helix domain-containing protein [Pseudomonas sp. LPH1]